jgi:hypothetical protein
LLAKGACRNRLAGLIGVGVSLLAKGACRNRLAGFASKVREQARSYPAPVILQFSKLTGGKPTVLPVWRIDGLTGQFNLNTVLQFYPVTVTERRFLLPMP